MIYDPFSFTSRFASLGFAPDRIGTVQRKAAKVRGAGTWDLLGWELGL
jgi:hypothetical protein